MNLFKRTLQTIKNVAKRIYSGITQTFTKQKEQPAQVMQTSSKQKEQYLTAGRLETIQRLASNIARRREALFQSNKYELIELNELLKGTHVESLIDTIQNKKRLMAARQAAGDTDFRINTEEIVKDWLTSYNKLTAENAEFEVNIMQELLSLNEAFMNPEALDKRQKYMDSMIKRQALEAYGKLSKFSNEQFKRFQVLEGLMFRSGLGAYYDSDELETLAMNLAAEPKDFNTVIDELLDKLDKLAEKESGIGDVSGTDVTKLFGLKPRMFNIG